ncbi:SemiSWEET transporter [Chitinivorax sp. PXF-14]|uniref:SemiSWEET transporter n=1 Tax=Chitinivorax sp. PXF-14 TaxID=3230488 RepID=UPI00346604ED
MTLHDIVGLLAGFLTTTAFIPQVRHVWRTKSAKDISLGMYLIFVCGVALWLVYGIWIDAWPVIAANAVTLLLSGAVLVMKLRFDR